MNNIKAKINNIGESAKPKSQVSRSPIAPREVSNQLKPKVSKGQMKNDIILYQLDVPKMVHRYVRNCI